MGMPNSGYGKPAGRTWQERQEDSARDNWNAQGPGIQRDQTNAGRNRDNTRTSADRAMETFNAGRPSNTQNFAPLNVAGYAPNQLAQWQSSAQGAASLFGGGRSAVPQGGGQLEGFDSAELRDFNADDVSNFDPSQYGGEYFKGAQGEFERGLEDDLGNLRDRAAGSGRLNTGFFDADQGSVVNRNSDQFADKLSQAATVFSGQRLDAVTSGARLRFDRASGIDDNMLERAGSMDENAIAAGRAQDDFTLGQGNQALDFQRMGLDAAGQQDELGYRRASDMDEMGFRRSTFLDDQNFARGKTGLDAALEREGRYMDDYHRYADRTGEYASSSRDWAAQDREMQDQRDAVTRAAQRRPMAYGHPKRNDDQNNPMRILAGQLGVPYKG